MCRQWCTLTLWWWYSGCARGYMSSLSPGISSAAAAAAGGAINFRSRTTAFNVCCVPLRFVWCILGCFDTNAVCVTNCLNCRRVCCHSALQLFVVIACAPAVLKAHHIWSRFSLKVNLTKFKCSCDFFFFKYPRKCFLVQIKIPQRSFPRRGS
jgi:hypothetical protein